MKFIINLSFLAAIAFAACNQPATDNKSTATSTEPKFSLEKKWETDTVFTTCESVIYDKANDVLYVSNIEGAPNGMDGVGSIGRLSLDGKEVNARWIEGLNAPKGMGIYNGHLFVADLNAVVEIDIAAGKILKRYPVDSSIFLNDITVSADGKVYVSDSEKGVVSVLENGKITSVLKDIKGPNGLLLDGDKFLMAIWNEKTLNTVDLTTGVVTMRTDSIPNPDGIEAVGDGGYLVSSWNGMVHYVGADWKKVKLLDTTAGEESAADIAYIPSKNLLLVPAFFKNKVVAYELKRG